MALRTIVQDGDPILKKVCRPVVTIDWAYCSTI